MPGEALLIIDMVYDFIYGRLKCESCVGVIDNIKKLIEVARSSGIPVIYVNDSHFPSDPELRLWGEHSMRGDNSSKIIEELGPSANDYVLEKRTYSAFFETGLDLLLRSLGVKRIVLTGIHTHICVKHTAADAFFRDYKVTVVRDATATFNSKDHEEALSYMKTIYGAEIVGTLDLIHRWKSMTR